jgi:hypothetical protein
MRTERLGVVHGLCDCDYGKSDAVLMLSKCRDSVSTETVIQKPVM